MKILAICGSLQARSANRALIDLAVRLAPPGVEVVPFASLGDLPHFNPDLDGPACPEPVLRFRRAVADSDALLIVSPEYGHSLPGVLKNAIDWSIGSGEMEEKLIAITASTPIAVRGRLGLRALRDTLSAVKARLIGGEPVVRGAHEEADLQALLRTLAERAARPPAGTAAAPPDVHIAPLGPPEQAAYNDFLLAGIAAHPDTLRIARADVEQSPFSTAETPWAATLAARTAAGTWIGVVTVEREQGRQKRHHIAWIYRMYVAANHAGSGVGRALLRAALERARTMSGVGKVNLTVAAHNRRAISLYMSEGFREFAREEDAFRDPAPRAELSMALNLEQ